MEVLQGDLKHLYRSRLAKQDCTFRQMKRSGAGPAEVRLYLSQKKLDCSPLRKRWRRGIRSRRASRAQEDNKSDRWQRSEEPLDKPEGDEDEQRARSFVSEHHGGVKAVLAAAEALRRAVLDSQGGWKHRSRGGWRHDEMQWQRVRVLWERPTHEEESEDDAFSHWWGNE